MSQLWGKFWLCLRTPDIIPHNTASARKAWAPLPTELPPTKEPPRPRSNISSGKHLPHPPPTQRQSWWHPPLGTPRAFPIMHRKGLFLGLTWAWRSSLRTEPCLIYLPSIGTQCKKVEGERKGGSGRKKERQERKQERRNEQVKQGYQGKIH